MYMYICSSVCQPESELQPQSDDEEDKGATIPATIPKPGKVLQAMCTARASLELNGTGLHMVYTVEGQVIKLISNTHTAT